MPKYSLDEIKALVQADAWELATRSARRDVLNLDYERSTVRAVLLAVQEADFRKSVGPCQTEFGAVEADVYRLCFDDVGLCRGTGDDLYLKLGILRDEANGDVVLVVSLHLSRWI